MGQRIVRKPLPTPVVQNKEQEPTVSPVVNTQDYYYSDCDFPELHGMEPLRQAPLEFQVHGYKGGGHALGTPEAQAAACHIGLCNALNYVRDRTKAPLNRWCATSQLQVYPRAGREFNAYYDRRALRFFYDTNWLGKVVYTSEASTIVVHELGHAILDSLRPDFWSTQALEIHAFHEAFGDCMALVHLTMYEPFCQHIMKVTGGNLRQSNPLSQLAMEMGTAIYRTKRPLRDAWNTFRYVQPEILPSYVSNDGLSSESHSFSRVWTGAFYEMIVAAYEHLLVQGKHPLTALRTATGAMSKYLLHGVATSANTPRYFDAVAHAMLAVDQGDGSPYQQLMTGVLSQRGILQSRLMMMDDVTPEDVPGDEVLAAGDVLVKQSISTKTLKLADKVDVMAMSDNPLYNVEIEVASSSYYHFAGGHLVDMIVPDEAEVLDAAMSSVQFLHENGYVGQEQPWDVQDGKLVRQHYNCCWGGYNNVMLKGSPEFGKPWKPQNNAGCGCHCKAQAQDVPEPQKLGCYLTEQTCQTARAKTCQLVRQRAC